MCVQQWQISSLSLQTAACSCICCILFVPPPFCTFLTKSIPHTRLFGRIYIEESPAIASCQESDSVLLRACQIHFPSETTDAKETVIEDSNLMCRKYEGPTQKLFVTSTLNSENVNLISARNMVSEIRSLPNICRTCQRIPRSK